MEPLRLVEPREDALEVVEHAPARAERHAERVRDDVEILSRLDRELLPEELAHDVVVDCVISRGDHLRRLADGERQVIVQQPGLLQKVLYPLERVVVVGRLLLKQIEHVLGRRVVARPAARRASLQRRLAHRHAFDPAVEALDVDHRRVRDEHLRGHAEEHLDDDDVRPNDGGSVGQFLGWVKRFVSRDPGR